MSRTVTSIAAFVAVVIVVVVAIVIVRGADADFGEPAAVVPGDALVYVEAVVRPEGEAKDDAEAALSRLLDSDDPGAELRRLIEESSDQDIDFDADIEPWLGERAALFLAGSEGEEPDGAVVVEATDSEEALEAARRTSDNVRPGAEVDGRSYELYDDDDGEEQAFGVFDDFFVAGDQAAVRAAAEAGGGAEALADSDRFEDAADAVPGDGLGFLYLEPDTIIEQSRGEIDPVGRDVLERVLDTEEPVVGTISASEDDVTMDVTFGGLELGGGESAALGSVPANAWLAVGLPDLGGIVDSLVERVEEAGIPGIGEGTVETLLRLQGIELDTEVVGWPGEAAFFLTGATEEALGGGLAIESRDPDASRRFLDSVRGLIDASEDADARPLRLPGGGEGFDVVSPDLPRPVHVVQREDRVVIGYGEAQTQEAFDAGQTLAEVSSFEAAQSKLDDLGVSAFVGLQPVFDLARATGGLSAADYREAKRYLDHLDYVGLGTRSEDGGSEIRIVLGLQ